jgi:hypothetical protein
MNGHETVAKWPSTVNGASVDVDAPSVTPMLWVIREHLKLTDTKLGCGAGLCGACVVHIDGKRAFSCQSRSPMLPGGDDHRGSHRYDLLKARFRQLETNRSKVSQSNATGFS